ncbi:MAG: hypothetical protein Q8O67_22005 [Deltaproteobacteria bacterium]|nr:hypothetical protein [Deltaproteobacteria bacterium]
MQLSSLVAVVLVGVGLAGATPAGLVGRWTFADEYGLQSWKVDILPDGRYRTRIAYGGVETVDETGRWQADGATYSIFVGDVSVSYAMSLSGNQMTLSGGNFPAPMTFTKVAGSEGSVVAEMKKRDGAAAGEDALWLARIKLGPLVKGPSFAGTGRPDASFNRVFDGATVFAPGTLYIWMGSQKELIDDTGRSHGLTHDQMTYEFQSNGRVHIVSTNHPVRAPVAGVITEFWGRYRVDGDNITVETDAGEKETTRLTLGRRRMSSPNLAFDEVNWARESIEAFTKGR